MQQSSEAKGARKDKGSGLHRLSNEDDLLIFLCSSAHPEKRTNTFVLSFKYSHMSEFPFGIAVVQKTDRTHGDTGRRVADK